MIIRRFIIENSFYAVEDEDGRTLLVDEGHHPHYLRTLDILNAFIEKVKESEATLPPRTYVMSKGVFADVLYFIFADGVQSWKMAWNLKNVPLDVIPAIQMIASTGDFEAVGRYIQTLREIEKSLLTPRPAP